MPATVGSILTDKGRDVWSVSPTTSVYDAARIMADRRVGALLVISPFGLVGIFSERDYASRVIVPSRDR
jgi:CBS domain-containing protein